MRTFSIRDRTGARAAPQARGLRRSDLRVLYVLFGVAESAILPAFALLFRHRGLQPAQIGVMLSALALVVLIASPLGGYVADRFLGPGRALAGTTTVAAAIAVLATVVAPTRPFLVTVACLWAFRAPVAALGDSVALRHLEPSGRADYGRLRLWMSASYALASVGWGGLLAATTVDAMLPAYAAAMAAVAAWSWIVIAPSGGRPPVAAHPGAEPVTRRRDALRDRTLLKFLLQMLLVSAAFSSTYNFLSLRITGLGGTVLLVGVAAGLQAAAEIPAMRLTAPIARRIGHGRLFALGCALLGASYLAWAVVRSPAAVVVLKLVVGFGFAFLYVGSVLVVDDIVPVSLRTTGQSLTRAVSFGLGPVLGGLSGGLVYGTLGPAPMFAIAALLAFVAGGLQLVGRAPAPG